MSSASLRGDVKGGIFNIKVYNGGNAVCGPGASATISRKYHKSSCPRHDDKAICYPFDEDYHKSEMLQGPEQLITDIPAKVYQKLEVQLSSGQSDCKTLACQIFPNIRQDQIEYLTTRSPTSKAKGIFKKMSEKGVTLGQLVDALKSIERQDAIETLIEAGYPRDPDNMIGNGESAVEEACSIIQEEAAALDEAIEEIPHQENLCFEKNSYRVFIEEPTMRASVNSKDASSSSVIKNLMTKVCLVQFPTTPEESFTSAVSFIEDIERV